MSKQLALGLLILAGFAGSARGQSLADVAKKEEDRRKALPQPAKVYTNKDLADVPAGSPQPAPATAADASKDTADKDTKDTKGTKDTQDAKGSDKSKDTGAKDQAYWAGRQRGLRDQLDRDMTFADALQTKVNSLTTDFANRDNPAQRAVIERDRLKAISEIARLKKAVLDDQKALADFQEEARRAGVLPGWLR